MPRKLRVAVIGVGYLGRFHAQKFKMLPQCELRAVVDRDATRAGEVGRELGVPGHGDDVLESILGQVDAVSIAVPTGEHHRVAMHCLAAGKHVLVEKPIAATAAQAEEMVACARRGGVVLQVGHLERFNPAFLACRPHIEQPQFIEAIRIHSFLERGSDVDVVLDLMSHDLDLVLALVASPVADLHAVGITLVTRSTDLANVRLIFQNGCVANLTASRISTKSERTLRLFQRRRYIAMDLAAPSARIYTHERLGDGGAPAKYREERPPLEKGDALLAELESFLGAASEGAAPAVSGADGLRTLALAERIIAEIARNRLP